MKNPLLIVVMTVFLCGCSHLDQIKSKEKAAATAQDTNRKNLDAITARASDYGQEAKYAVSLMPDSPEKKATDEILGLQLQLVGGGNMAQADREAFVTSVIKDNLDAHRQLFEAGKVDADLKTKLAASDKKVIETTSALKSVTEQAASNWDSYSHLWDCVYALIALGVVVMVLWAIAKFGTAATVAATKLP